MIFFKETYRREGFLYFILHSIFYIVLDIFICYFANNLHFLSFCHFYVNRSRFSITFANNPFTTLFFHKTMSKNPVNCSIFVLDTEQQALLSSFISEFYTLRVTRILSSRSEAMEYLNQNCPTILFLDLDMQDLLHFIPKPPYIIGIGSKNAQKKIKDFLNLGFSDFIFLPIQRDNVQNVMGKFFNLHKCLSGAEESEPMAAENRIIYNNSDLKFQTNKDFIFVNDRKNGYCRVFCDEILYAQNVGNEIRVAKENGSTVYDKKNLKNFIKMLPPHNFLKINRSTVINLHKVNRVDKKNITINNMVFRVTRTFYKTVAKYL